MARAPHDAIPVRRPGAIVAPVWPLRLVPAIALLGLVAAGAGPYRFDTVVAGAGARGTDAVTLLVGVPLLLLAAGAYRSGSLMGGLLQDRTPPLLGPYTTLFTHALDLAVIAPAALWAGTRVMRQGPVAYVLAVALLTLEVLLAPLIVAQTVSQWQAGVTFTRAEVAGPVGGFRVLSLGAAWASFRLLRTVRRVAP